MSGIGFMAIKEFTTTFNTTTTYDTSKTTTTTYDTTNSTTTTYQTSHSTTTTYQTSHSTTTTYQTSRSTTTSFNTSRGTSRSTSSNTYLYNGVYYSAAPNLGLMQYGTNSNLRYIMAIGNNYGLVATNFGQYFNVATQNGMYYPGNQGNWFVAVHSLNAAFGWGKQWKLQAYRGTSGTTSYTTTFGTSRSTTTYFNTSKSTTTTYNTSHSTTTTYDTSHSTTTTFQTTKDTTTTYQTSKDTATTRTTNFYS